MIGEEVLNTEICDAIKELDDAPIPEDNRLIHDGTAVITLEAYVNRLRAQRRNEG